RHPDRHHEKRCVDRPDHARGPDPRQRHHLARSRVPPRHQPAAVCTAPDRGRSRGVSERVARLAAIVRADVLIRLRRPSTAVIFLLLSMTPYPWIPDISTGRTLIEIGGHRALYNSAAIGMGTAVLGTFFIGLAGFYVVSNALR